MPEHFEISRIQESFRIDDAGETTQTKQILFRVGKDGPFSIEVPSKDFDPDKVTKMLEVEADKIRKLRGER